MHLMQSLGSPSRFGHGPVSIARARVAQVLCMMMALGLVVLSGPGCSIRRYALHKLGDALSQSGTSFARDDDPDLIKDAAPFSLKLMESLLAETPQHTGLLLSAASGFTQYAYAFVQQDADEM